MPNFIAADLIERALVQKRQHVDGYDAPEWGTTEREDLNVGSGRANRLHPTGNNSASSTCGTGLAFAGSCGTLTDPTAGPEPVEWAVL